MMAQITRSILRLVSLAICFTLIAISASAFSTVTTNIDDEALADRPISEVLIQGLGRVTEQEIRNNLRIATGQPFDSKSIKDDVTTLYRLGYFDSVTTDAELLPDGTVRVRYILIEQPIIKDIQVVGNKVASDQELRAVIGLYAGSPRDDFLLERAIEKIKISIAPKAIT